MAEQLVLRGTLEGHTGWVTSLATSLEKYVPRIAGVACVCKLESLHGTSNPLALRPQCAVTDSPTAPTCSCPAPETRP